VEGAGAVKLLELHKESCQMQLHGELGLVPKDLEADISVMKMHLYRICQETFSCEALIKLKKV
jgi:hypothetical protein